MPEPYLLFNFSGKLIPRSSWLEELKLSLQNLVGRSYPGQLRGQLVPALAVTWAVGSYFQYFGTWQVLR